MEHVEAEVIDGACDWKRGIGVLAELALVNVPVQTMIVNGVEQTIMGEAYELRCPECGHPVKIFPAGAPVGDILAALTAKNGDTKKLSSWTHCQKCGQKLHIFRPTPFSGMTAKKGTQASAEGKADTSSQEKESDK